MDIEFPVNEAWDSSRDSASFPAECDGDRILCRISWEALTDHFGGDRGGNPLDPLRNNRVVIQAKAEQKIRAGQLEADGTVLMRSSDF